MAKNSICSACGMTVEGEAKFCPTCGSSMTIQEVPAPEMNASAPEMNAIPPQLQNAMNGTSASDVSSAPFEGNPGEIPPIPPVDNGMGNIPPVPPVDNSFGSIPPVPPANNSFGSTPPYGSNMNMNMGMQQPPQKSGKDGLAIAGMIIGIVSIVLMCFNWVDALIAVVGLILSILGLKSLRRKGMAVAGTICSVVGLLGSILVLIIYLFVIGKSVDLAESAMNGDFDAFIEEYEDIYGDLDDDYSYEYHYNWE